MGTREHAGGATALECMDDERRRAVRNATLNGIDYVEVSDDQKTITVFFLGKAPRDIGVPNVRIEGGRRVRDIRVERVDVHTAPRRGRDDWMEVTVDRPGDFSTYTLRLVEPGEHPRPMRGFDPRYASLDFSFKAGCASDLDCVTESQCAPGLHDRPEINYLARDYQGFRQLLLDRLAVVMPEWRERHAPDLGVTLVELLAYTGDYLSQFQDAVATEAYLDTARRRVSVRRHARLVDYHLYEGCNARAWLALTTSFDVELDLAAIKFATRVEGGPRGGDTITLDELRRLDAVSEIFEVAWPRTQRFWVRRNLSEIRFYTWGDSDCCIPAGATEATLLDEWLEEPQAPPSGGDVAGVPGAHGADVAPRAAARRRRLDSLDVGDLLLLEEAIGPRTGSPADADPAHRHVVRLIEVRRDVDSLFPVRDGESRGTPILHVRWRKDDALPFALCLSTHRPAPDCGPLTDVSVARGNVILVDHGLTVDENLPPVPTADPIPSCDPCDDVETPATAERYEPVLELSPLTFRASLDTSGSAMRMMRHESRESQAQVDVAALVRLPEGIDARDPTLHWTPRADLLDSAASGRHVVVEIDDEGLPHLRFSTSAESRPERDTRLAVRYRIGNGLAGNVGAETITVLVADEAALGGARLLARNPLPARGGERAETVAEAKQFAPSAFRARRERAVIAEDYAELLERDFEGEVQGAAAAMRWNGSWFEVQVGVDARDSEQATSGLLHRARGRLHRYRRIGHDVDVESARLVPLTIAMDVCVSSQDLRAPVLAALRDLFGSKRRRDGRLGFFHPDSLQYGQPITISALVAAAQAIPGVASLAITRLERMGEGPNQELENGLLPLGPLEIAQVDNDPTYPDRGTITFNLQGGR